MNHNWAPSSGNRALDHAVSRAHKAILGAKGRAGSPMLATGVSSSLGVSLLSLGLSLIHI